MEEDKGLHDDDKKPGFVSNHVIDRPGSCLDLFSAIVDSLQDMCSLERESNLGACSLGPNSVSFQTCQHMRKDHGKCPIWGKILVTLADNKVQW